jgi:uncharacterized damage-inducible protein DinB
MTTPAYFQTLARYNQWANRRLYTACAELADADYRAPRRAFFGSIHGTLNHLLVTDRIWMGRIEGLASGINALNQILFEDFGELRAAREAEDERIVAFADQLTADMLDKALVYKNTTGKPFETPMVWVLAHLFNHQTHHRGQAHGLLSQTEVAPPPLDLMMYLRQMSSDPAASA